MRASVPGFHLLVETECAMLVLHYVLHAPHMDTWLPHDLGFSPAGPTEVSMFIGDRGRRCITAAAVAWFTARSYVQESTLR